MIQISPLGIMVIIYFMIMIPGLCLRIKKIHSEDDGIILTNRFLKVERVIFVTWMGYSVILNSVLVMVLFEIYQHFPGR